jgi:hypothetical protein
MTRTTFFYEFYLIIFGPTQVGVIFPTLGDYSEIFDLMGRQGLCGGATAVDVPRPIFPWGVPLL